MSWKPGEYTGRNFDHNDWDRIRLTQNVLAVVAAASAAQYGFHDTGLLLEDLDHVDTVKNEPFVYRIAGAYTLVTALLDLLSEETGQSAVEVLKDLGLRANQHLFALVEQEVLRNPPEDPPPPLEPV